MHCKMGKWTTRRLGSHKRRIVLRVYRIYIAGVYLILLLLLLLLECGHYDISLSFSEFFLKSNSLRKFCQRLLMKFKNTLFRIQLREDSLKINAGK